LLQIEIPGATVDQIDFRLDQVSTNSLNLQFNTCYLKFLMVLGGGRHLLKGRPY
jgi:hypothetical protein